MGNKTPREWLPGDDTGNDYNSYSDACCGDIILMNLKLYMIRNRNPKNNYVIGHHITEEFLSGDVSSPSIQGKLLSVYSSDIAVIHQQHESISWEKYQNWLKNEYQKYKSRLDHLNKYPKEITKIIDNDHELLRWYNNVRAYIGGPLENSFMPTIKNAAAAKYLSSDETLDKLINIEIGNLYFESVIIENVEKCYLFEATNIDEARTRAKPFIDTFINECKNDHMVPVSYKVISKGNDNYELKLTANKSKK